MERFDGCDGLERYARNSPAISPEETLRLESGRVCVVGAGGLGGYIIEMLGRVGVGHITVVDGDVFEPTNLNRQILSASSVIGKSKAATAKVRMHDVNPRVTVNPVAERLTRENAAATIGGHEVAVDAVDNVETRLLLEDAAEQAGVPLVHGAIGGWYGQVTTVFPGDRMLHKLYGAGEAERKLPKPGNPSFTPASVAALEAAEVIKLLLGRGRVLRGELMTLDLLEGKAEVFKIG